MRGLCYDIEFCEKRGGVVPLFIYRVCEPIIHPAVCSTFGPDYGMIVAWSEADAKQQFYRARASMLIPQNQDARELFETDAAEFYRLNEKIRKTTHCAVCHQNEKNRRTLFSCFKGHVFHILCGLGKKCPVCAAFSHSVDV
jgi:hypothetical protein